MIELEKIDKCIYEELKALLFEMVPGYERIFAQIQDNLSENDIYLFMHEFSTFLGEEMEKCTSNVFISNAFNFINKIGESNNLEILNILKVGILETLYTIPHLDRKQVFHHLSDKLQGYFQECSKYYR